MTRTLYAIQIKTANGWKFGPPFLGLDIKTELVGSNFISSYERAYEYATELSKNRLKGTVRIIPYSLNLDKNITII